MPDCIWRVDSVFRFCVKLWAIFNIYQSVLLALLYSLCLFVSIIFSLVLCCRKLEQVNVCSFVSKRWLSIADKFFLLYACLILQGVSLKDGSKGLEELSSDPSLSAGYRFVGQHNAILKAALLLKDSLAVCHDSYCSIVVYCAIWPVTGLWLQSQTTVARRAS